MTCDCDCHKIKDKNELRKCQEQNKRSKKEVDALKKKLLSLTIAFAIVGTLIGKEGLDKVLEYLETFDKVKQSTTRLIETTSRDSDLPLPIYFGTSPSPSTLGVFALTAMMPPKRRT